MKKIKLSLALASLLMLGGCAKEMGCDKHHDKDKHHHDCKHHDHNQTPPPSNSGSSVNTNPVNS